MGKPMNRTTNDKQSGSKVRIGNKESSVCNPITRSFSPEMLNLRYSSDNAISRSSLLADESNDSGLGELPFPSVYESNFNAFKDEDAVDECITSPLLCSLPSQNTNFNIKSFTDSIPKDNPKPEPRIIIEKRKLDTVDPNTVKKKKVSISDKTSDSTSSATKCSKGVENYLQENVPLRKRCENLIKDSAVSTKSKSKRSILCGNYSSVSKNGQVRIEIVNQPERQHRARYLTEGSRGAVKDQSGNGFPEVKLFGYSKKVKLQVFVGTDVGKVQPHLFYQAIKVCGKHSTPCSEKKIDGTVVLDIDLDPDQDMAVSCDCVGILKERNVDVEKRLAICGTYPHKKKCTKCRLIFRVTIPNPSCPSGVETLQIASCTISCTQLPGIPEILKKSLSECDVDGKNELFIIGKNFLKETQVVFEEIGSSNQKLPGSRWRVSVIPDKNYLQSNHLVCEVPPYQDQSITKEIQVNLVLVSGGKTSEPHVFTYKPLVAQGVCHKEDSFAVASPVCKAINDPAYHQNTNVIYDENSKESSSVVGTVRSTVDASQILSSNSGTNTNLDRTPTSPTYRNVLLSNSPPVQIKPIVSTNSVISTSNNCISFGTELQQVCATGVPGNRIMSPQLVNVVQPSQILQTMPIQALVLAGNQTLLIKQGSAQGVVVENPSPVIDSNSLKVVTKNFSANTISPMQLDVLQACHDHEIASKTWPKQSTETSTSSSSSQKMPAALPAEGFIESLNAQNTAEGKPKTVRKENKDSFNQHVNLMTAFSELADADLLKLINPSTFDNV